MTEEIEIVDDRHPLRFLVKFAVFAGLLYVAGRFLAQKKDEYADLTESEAREKLVDTIAPRVGDETAGDIADQVIPKLKDRGLIKPDPMEAAADAVSEAAHDVGKGVKDKIDDAGDKAGDVADKVTEAVDSVVKD
jgi:hypothetical protein